MMLIVSTERKGDIMRQDVLNEINIFLRGGEKETMSKAAMARIMGCDPRTVKRYLEGYEPKKIWVKDVDKYIQTLYDDVSHYCSMYDYRNTGADADWGNSKDSIERSISFLTSR